MLSFKSVTAGYNKNIVLNNISACFEKGKFTCIIGPNGSGKSTVLRVAHRLIVPFSGEVTADSINLASMNRQEIAKKIAFLSQGKAAPDMTVQEAVLHGRFPHLSFPRKYSANDRKIAAGAMEQMGVAHLKEKPISCLSGGTKQKVFIAMALAQSTDYILLDEPTTFLDIAHQLSLMKTLKALAAGGKGVVAVMHDLPLTFAFADEILLINNGDAIIKGTPDTVMESGKIKEIFSVELKKNGREYGYIF